MDRNTSHGIANYPVKLVDNGDDTYSVATKLVGSLANVAGNKTVTVAGTPELLGVDQQIQGVYVTASPSNTGAVYIFPVTGAKTDVIPLNAGDSDFWPISNLNGLKIDADVSGDGVYWKGAV